MEKKIYKYNSINDKIRQSVDIIADPVKQTLSPRGGNVLFENQGGEFIMTNDGVTIAKEIAVKDRLSNAVIEIVKGAALKTNSEAGDGTTTTIILTQVLSKESLKLRDEGVSWIDIKEGLNQIGHSVGAQLEKLKLDITTDKELHEVALISANNDESIAKDVVETIKTAGDDGMIFLEPNNKKETELIKDLGFMIKQGLLYQELLFEPRPVIQVKDVPVLLTDKRLYYSDEAEHILRTAIEAGWKRVAIVARDFVGEALATLLANHKKNIDVILIKDPKCTDKDTTSLDDLACYIGGKVFVDKITSLTDGLSKAHFAFVNQIYQDPQKTLITPKSSGSKALKERIKYLKEELVKDKENKQVKERLSSLTDGVVTVKIGGSTAIELREKIYRYEDAVNATRSAKKFGYLVGGGVSLLHSYKVGDYNEMFKPIAKKFTESIVRQVAKNCGKHEDSVVEKIGDSNDKHYGYNALTNTYEDLLKSGVLDAYMAVKQSVENSISATTSLISINYYLINDIEDDKENKTQSGRTKKD